MYQNEIKLGDKFNAQRAEFEGWDVWEDELDMVGWGEPSMKVIVWVDDCGEICNIQDWPYSY